MINNTAELQGCVARLSASLTEASTIRLEHGLLNPDELHAAIGDEEYARIIAATDRLALLRELDALARFVLEVSIEERQSDLLGSKTDEMDSFGEFPYLRVLRRILEPSGDISTDLHVGDRFLKRLLFCLHDDTSFLCWIEDRVSNPIGGRNPNVKRENEIEENKNAAAATAAMTSERNPHVINNVSTSNL